MNLSFFKKRQGSSHEQESACKPKRQLHPIVKKVILVFRIILTVLLGLFVAMSLSVLIGMGWMVTFGISAWFLFFDIVVAVLAVFVNHKVYERMKKIMFEVP